MKGIPQKKILDKLSIYVPQAKMAQEPVERLMKLSEKKDRSVNYLVVEAILEYLNREEKKGEPGSAPAALTAGHSRLWFPSPHVG